MTTKHAAALAALNAGCEVLYAPHNHYVAWTNDEQGRKKLGVGATPIDALAAAADALGLESRYVVTEKAPCFRCGKLHNPNADTMRYGWSVRHQAYGFVCADGCNSEEEKR